MGDKTACARCGAPVVQDDHCQDCLELIDDEFEDDEDDDSDDGDDDDLDYEESEEERDGR